MEDRVHMSDVNNPQIPNAARIYDYLLGGHYHLEVDRQAAEAMLKMFPQSRNVVRANRIFLGQAVEYMVEAGIRQFLDVGSGLPALGSSHQVAQQLAPDSRVVYVDIDSVAVNLSKEIVDKDKVDNVLVICEDARNLNALLSREDVNEVIDFSQPVGLLFVALLHFIEDAKVSEIMTTVRRRLAKRLFCGALSWYTGWVPP